MDPYRCVHSWYQTTHTGSELDFHRNDLSDLRVVGIRISCRERRECRCRRVADLFHDTAVRGAWIRINVHVDGLTHFDVIDFRFLDIGGDPQVVHVVRVRERCTCSDKLVVDGQVLNNGGVRWIRHVDIRRTIPRRALNRTDGITTVKMLSNLSIPIGQFPRCRRSNDDLLSRYLRVIRFDVICRLVVEVVPDKARNDDDEDEARLKYNHTFRIHSVSVSFHSEHGSMSWCLHDGTDSKCRFPLKLLFLYKGPTFSSDRHPDGSDRHDDTRHKQHRE